MKFQTSISKTKDGVHSIRGHNIVDLMKKHPFMDVVFLLLRGNLPQEGESKLLDAIFVASSEHGINAPSLFVPRVSASVGNNTRTALASGVLATGDYHGGAVEEAARLLSLGKTPKEIVEEYKKNKKVIPGFGHKTYKKEDPRATALRDLVKSLGLSFEPFELAYEIEKELSNMKGKKIPLNLDGAIAASLLVLGFDTRVGDALFIIPRMAGMTAHILEEYSQKNSYRRLDEGDVEYTPEYRPPE